MNNLRNGKTFRLALLGVLTAIIFLQSFVPFLGFIPIQPFNPTIIHITVIIGAVILGPVFGGVLGLIWGLLVLFRAFALPTSPIDPIVFTNPIVSVLPRVLLGVFSGYTFLFFKKIEKTGIVAASIAGIVGSVTNTVLVLGFIYLLYREPYANFYQMDVTALLPALITIALTNGIVEGIVALIITPAVVKPLLILYKGLYVSKDAKVI